MNFVLCIALTALIGWGGQFLFPWWIVLLAGFIGGVLMKEKVYWGFWCGFLGIGLLWFFHAWMIHVQTGGILSDRVASLFSFDSGAAMVFLTGLTGGIAGGLGGLAGTSLRKLFSREKRRRKIYF